MNIKWAADYGKNWVVGIWLVEKLSSEQLMERLVKKGKRNSEYTRDLIKKKLTDDDDGIATTNLKVTVSCPLGNFLEEYIYIKVWFFKKIKNNVQQEIIDLKLLV